MKILHTVAPAEVGGLEEVVLRLCGGLRSHGHDVTVLSVHDSAPDGHPFLDALRADARVSVETLVVPPRGYLAEVRGVRAFCERLEPDILHSHGFRPCVLHPLAVRRKSVPVIATLHGFTGGGVKSRFYEWLQIRSVAGMDAAVAVSEPLAKRLRSEGVPPSILHVVKNAWEPRVGRTDRSTAREALGVPQGAFHLGWVGRLSREKGPDVMVAAIERLGDLPEAWTSFVGDGPLRKELERRVAESSLERVTFHGSIPEAWRLFTAFDAFVLSSRTEGTPIVLFEAMGSEVPVIATEVGGVPDVVDSGSALLVPPDDPHALADAIRAAAADPDGMRERVARAAGVLEEEFAVEPWLERYEAIYRDIVDRGLARRPE